MEALLASVLEKTLHFSPYLAAFVAGKVVTWARVKAAAGSINWSAIGATVKSWFTKS
jgi:hypothetical protein